jgi:cytochrome c5
LGACGKEQSAAPEAPAPEAAAPAVAAPEAAAPEAPAAADASQGKSVYNKTCAMCHSSGAAGAPIPGDKAEWAPRIAQGTDVLHTHAINGYTGAKGVMPARGGAASLSDDEVKAAVDYMVGQSK